MSACHVCSDIPTASFACACVCTCTVVATAAMRRMLGLATRVNALMLEEEREEEREDGWMHTPLQSSKG